MNKQILAFIYCAVCSLLIGYYRVHNDDEAGVCAFIQMLATGMASLILFFLIEKTFVRYFIGFIIGFIAILFLESLLQHIDFYHGYNLNVIQYSFILEGSSFTLIYLIALFRLKANKHKPDSI